MASPSARPEWDTPEFWAMVERLRGGDAAAAEPALRFLDDDPWTFRSGYAKEQVVKALARHDFDHEEQVRIARICLRVVDVGDRWEFRWYCRLAHRVSPSVLREALAERLRHEDLGVARRAVWMLAKLRHPQLTAEQLDDARSLLLRLSQSPRPSWWTHSPRNLAVRFWSPEWEAQLLTIARVDSESRSAALRVLRSLPRLHLPDASAQVAAIAVAVVGDVESPDRDWSQALDQTSALTDPAELERALTPLLTSEDSEVRRRARIAIRILNGEHENE